MTTLQAICFGAMLAWTPSLVVLALLLREAPLDELQHFGRFPGEWQLFLDPLAQFIQFAQLRARHLIQRHPAIVFRYGGVAHLTTQSS